MTITKVIKFPKGTIISAFNGPTAEITPTLIDEIMTPINRNKYIILDAAIDIERIIDSIIRHHFFGYNKELDEKSEEFRNQILNSDWCTFASKRKLLSFIINSNVLCYQKYNACLI